MSGITTTTRSIARADPDLALIDEAVAVLRRGGLVAFPTETVYGLGGDATNPAAAARIYQAKGRPASNPLIVHAHDLDAVRPAVSAWPRAAAILAERFWPGPLTLVLPRSGLIPDAVTAGQDTVGVRVPDCPVALLLLRRFGRPVAAPSANRSTGVSPTTAAHVVRDLDGLVDLILDAGPTPVGIESTVLDLSSVHPRMLRPGAITAGQIARVLGAPVETPAASESPAESPQLSPGRSEVHYAPRTLLTIAEPRQILEPSGVDSSPLGLIVAGHALPVVPRVYLRRVDWLDPAQAARALYATLHDWDDGSLARIDVILPPDVDAWHAVRDRLWRASRRWSREGRPQIRIPEPS